jgi:glycosyltransferase involved in cell wall biosynthesis
MKLAFVVQRYGLEINGGAELHCRWVAEHMKKFHDVEVLTTCAFDYVTWNNHYPEGEDVINGIPVRRFPVDRPRNPERFGRIQNHILDNEHSSDEELKWMEEEGPLTPALIDYIRSHRDEYDYFIFFSYRYYHSYWGVNSVPRQSILVPTAEHDAVIHLNLFKELFRKPRAIIYNSIEEKNMINTISSNRHMAADVVGVGTEIPARFSEEEFRQKFGVGEDYVVYIGRIDRNKGCDLLFRYFARFKEEIPNSTKLVLVGSSKLNIPARSDIEYLGFLSEEDKFSALAGASILMMPSFFESLSMVTLEAWALGKPVLANARCEVLKGQCLRGRAGLFYENYPEFRETLKLLLRSSRLRKAMGKNGQDYFKRNYSWSVIENKYLSLLGRLEGER